MKRVRFPTARDLSSAFATAINDISAPLTDQPSIPYLRSLVISPTPEDAISFCSYLLPRRDAVRWACDNVRRLIPGLESEEATLLHAVEGWIAEPDEVPRRKVMDLALHADRRLAATWVGLSAAWSGGSLTEPPDLPVPCPHHLTPQAARAAVLIALASRGFRERRNLLTQCVEHGITLATT